MFKVGSLLFISPVSAYTGSNPIFDIKATEDNNNIYTSMFYGSGGNVLYFGYMASSASPKRSVGGFGELLVIFSRNIRARQAKKCDRRCGI